MLFYNYPDILLFLLLIQVIQTYSLNSINYDVELDKIYPIDKPPEKAEPAVWGDPAPDFSKVVLDGGTTYLYALIFVDSKISRHYQNDMRIIKREILRMITEANEYFYQINIRINVVDVLETKRDDLSLYTFQDYHTRRIKELPYHDFAALIAYRYAGGLAYVSGMCSHRNILLCGFYPHNPEAMGAIFFHETAHLLGVPHDNRNDTLNVHNCYCNTRTLAEEITDVDVYRPSVGCLKIPGFDHDCTAQYLANVLHKNKCLPRKPRYNDDNVNDGYPDWSHVETGELSICGNGIVEAGEECDCGLLKYCKNSNCIAVTCKRKIPLYIFFFAAVFGFAIFFIFSVIGCYCVFKKVYSRFTFLLPSNKKRNWSRIACQPIKFFKRFIRLESKSRKSKTTANSHEYNRSHHTTETVISITPELMRSNADTLKPQRPKAAPPPIPYNKSIRPSIPPPKPLLTPCMIPLVDNSQSQVLTNKINQLNSDSSLKKYADFEDEETIKAKFADFDTDDDDEEYLSNDEMI